jgi:hypothetical protein
MSRVRVHNFSISLDGLGTGDGQSLEAPFGHAGHRLHDWFFPTLVADLVDDLHVVLVPIVLGRGERLCDDLATPEDRFLIESVSSPSGVTQLTFGHR